MKLEAFIKENLEDSIPGKIFTTEVEVAKKFGISRPTARKYLDTFCERGLIERIAGKGIAAASIENIPTKREPKNYMLMVSFSGIDDGYFSEIVKGISDRIFMNVKYDERLEFLQSLDLSEYDGAFISLYLKERGLTPRFLLSGKRKNLTSYERNGYQIDKSLRDRIRGVRCGLGLYNEPLPDEWFCELKYKEDILKCANEKTALVFYDATSVYGVWNYIKEKNEPLLEKLMICAFGNSLLKNDFANGVYIKFNGYEIGKAAAKLSERCKKGITVTHNVKTSLVTKKEK